MARHTTGPLIKFGALPQIALAFGPQKQPPGQPRAAHPAHAPLQDRIQPVHAVEERAKRLLPRPGQEMCSLEQQGDAARAAPGREMGSLEQAIDSDDVHRHVLKFLDGKACRTASEAVVRWRKLP